VLYRRGKKAQENFRRPKSSFDGKKGTEGRKNRDDTQEEEKGDPGKRNKNLFHEDSEHKKQDAIRFETMKTSGRRKATKGGTHQPKRPA